MIAKGNIIIQIQVPLNERFDRSNNRINDTSDKNMNILKGIAENYINQHKAELDSMIEQVTSSKHLK